MGFAQTVDAQGKPVHKSGKGSYHQIGLVRGQFGGVPFDRWVKFIAEAGFDGWEEASWELDLRKCDTDSGAAAYAQERVNIARQNGLEIFTVATHLQGQVLGDEPSAKTLNFCNPKGEARAAYSQWRKSGKNPPRTDPYFVPEEVGKLILETPEQLGAALSSRMAGIAGGANRADQVRQVAEMVYEFASAIATAQAGGWIGSIVGALLDLFIVGGGLIPMLLVLTGVTLFAKMTVAVMLAVGPIAILCNFFGMTRFVFEGWVKGIAFGIFTLLFSYIIAGFCFGFVRSYLDSIQIATATQEESFGVAAGLVLYMLVVAAFVVRVPSLALSFAYGAAFFGLPAAGSVGEGLRSAKNSGSRAANLATSLTPEGITGNAVRGTMAMAGDMGRGTRAMGRMLASRMRGRSG